MFPAARTARPPWCQCVRFSVSRDSNSTYFSRLVLPASAEGSLSSSSFSGRGAVAPAVVSGLRVAFCRPNNHLFLREVRFVYRRRSVKVFGSDGGRGSGGCRRRSDAASAELMRRVGLFGSLGIRTR